MLKRFLESQEQDFIKKNIQQACLLKEEDLGIFLEKWIKSIPTLLDLECVQAYYLKYPDILDELLESDIRNEIIDRDLVEYCTDSDEDLDYLPEVLDMDSKQLKKFYKNKKVSLSVSSSSCSGSSYGCETSGSECSVCSLD